MVGNFLEFQWLGLHTFTAEGTGSIPGQGTKIPQAARHSQKNKTERNKETWWNTSGFFLKFLPGNNTCHWGSHSITKVSQMTTYKFNKMGMYYTCTERNNKCSLLYNLSLIPSLGKYLKFRKINQKWSSNGGELGVGFLRGITKLWYKGSHIKAGEEEVWEGGQSREFFMACDSLGYEN